MKMYRRIRKRWNLAALGPLIGWCLVAGCAKQEEVRWQGYLEGEFVYMASSLPGRLEQLSVVRGETVTAGAALFELERGSEEAAREEMAQRLAQAEARWADLRKGQRPSELAMVSARLEQARAASELSALELARVRKLREKNVVSEADFDRARLSHERDLSQVVELEAQVVTAELGARSDAVTAAEAEVSAARAALVRAEWSVDEKRLVAATDALVYDTLFQVGEFVPASSPVVVLLPPGNLRVRFFVPEAVRATLAVGEAVEVSMSGREEPVEARINYLSPQPEFTPPVLYNRDNREKLVFMVEATFAAETAVELHPGQPVEVRR